MQKPEFSLTEDDTFGKAFIPACLIFIWIFVVMDRDGLGRFLAPENHYLYMRSIRLIDFLIFFAIFRLTRERKSGAKFEFYDFKISFLKGYERYDIFLMNIDYIRPSLGLMPSIRAPFLRHKSFVAFETPLKILVFLIYVAAVLFVIKSDLIPSVSLLAGAICALFAAAKIFTAYKTQAKFRLKDALLIRGKDSAGGDSLDKAKRK